MKSFEIRKAFLKYFEAQGHTIVPSSSLVPDDPTLLLVNSGMVQFKDLFLGREKRPYTRATTAQKCARLSGKHNDLEEVGPSPRHQTFFEMLGNFSFGDYFKREAIFYAWEFVTKTLKIDPMLISVTVYQDDDEAASLWREIAKLPESRIERLGKADNWWSMGDTGPNGPNSEIYYDRGIERCICSLKGKCTPKTSSEVEKCERFWEIWNLVFMQYNIDSSGKTTPLATPSVDTGMGLERITAVLQNKEANYDTDLFEPIFAAIRKLTGHSVAQMREQIVPYRVIADHGRAMTFLIADGVLPGNEDRSYVLRMLIRRAIRFGMKLGLNGPFLSSVSKSVIDHMGDVYPELRGRHDFILKAISVEEERFDKTYNSSMRYLEQLFEIKSKKAEKVLTGAEVFPLHDREGLHIQIIEDIAKEQGFSVDRVGFEAEMDMQRKRSKVTVSGSLRLEYKVEALPPTQFVGYESAQQTSEILGIFDKQLDKQIGVTTRLTPGMQGYIVFNASPFYPDGGGQVSDTGIIQNIDQTSKAKVINVEKRQHRIFFHQVEVIDGYFEKGENCKLEIDLPSRKATQRNHTATHILHAALRKVLNHKTGIQAGSLVAPDELRFDFTHFSALTEDEIRKIDEMSNEIILRDLPVRIAEERLEDAKAKGAMALFPEDYQGKEKVRVVSIVSETGIGSPFSIELCGGTHVSRTGEIGLFKIVREEGVAAGVRRVYVATGENLLRYLHEKEQILSTLSTQLKTSESEIPSKLELLINEKSQLEQQLKKLTTASLITMRDELVQSAERVSDCQILFKKIDLDVDALKELADLVEGQLEHGVVLFGSEQNGRALLIAKVSESLTKKIRAGDLVRDAAQIVGGKGGGNPRFAQGGGDQPKHLERALQEVRKTLQTKLGS
ncbi:alanine--tRNA ligase [Candidatus Acetothermia bacterium]|nr:alanine--tRNA ligase [Candidatus Acetothermia bacterium]MBI3643303.1 alanine--tRNA ligase [Candidatus Acetothermia bacterium]